MIGPLLRGRGNKNKEPLTGYGSSSRSRSTRLIRLIVSVRARRWLTVTDGIALNAGKKSASIARQFGPDWARLGEEVRYTCQCAVNLFRDTCGKAVLQTVLERVTPPNVNAMVPDACDVERYGESDGLRASSFVRQQWSQSARRRIHFSLRRSQYGYSAARAVPAISASVQRTLIGTRTSSTLVSAGKPHAGGADVRADHFVDSGLIESFVAMVRCRISR